MITSKHVFNVNISTEFPVKIFGGSSVGRAGVYVLIE